MSSARPVRTCADIYGKLEACKTFNEYMEYLESINVITRPEQAAKADDFFNFGQRQNDRDMVIMGKMVLHLKQIADSSQCGVIDALYKKIYVISDNSRLMLFTGGPNGEREDVIHTQIDRFIAFIQAVANKTYYKNLNRPSIGASSSRINIQPSALAASSFLSSREATQQQDSGLNHAENDASSMKMK